MWCASTNQSISLIVPSMRYVPGGTITVPYGRAPPHRSANTHDRADYCTLLAMGRYGPGVTYTVPRRATMKALPPIGPLGRLMGDHECWTLGVQIPQKSRYVSDIQIHDCSPVEASSVGCVDGHGCGMGAACWWLACLLSARFLVTENQQHYYTSVLIHVMAVHSRGEINKIELKPRSLLSLDR